MTYVMSLSTSISNCKHCWSTLWALGPVLLLTAASFPPALCSWKTEKVKKLSTSMFWEMAYCRGPPFPQDLDEFTVALRVPLPGPDRHPRIPSLCLIRDQLKCFSPPTNHNKILANQSSLSFSPSPGPGPVWVWGSRQPVHHSPPGKSWPEGKAFSYLLSPLSSQPPSLPPLSSPVYFSL